MTAEIERHLEKEMEGKMYEHIWIMYAFGSYFITKNYYFVKGGVVYEISENRELPTGDTLFNTQKDCYCIGKRNSRRNYKTKSYSCTPKELNAKLKL